MLRFSLFVCLALQFWIALAAHALAAPVNGPAFEGRRQVVLTDMSRRELPTDGTELPLLALGHDRAEILLELLEVPELPEFIRSDAVSVTLASTTATPHPVALHRRMPPLLDGLKRPPRWARFS